MLTEIEKQRIKTHIEQNGLKRVWIAQKLKVSEAALSNYLAGRRTPTSELIGRLKTIINL